VIAILEDGLIRRRVKCVAIDTRDLVSTLVDYQASYYITETLNRSSDLERRKLHIKFK